MVFSLAPAAWWPEQPMGICSLSLSPHHRPACLKWLHGQARDTWPWRAALLRSAHMSQRPLQQTSRAAAWGWQHQGAVFRWMRRDYLSTEAEHSCRYHWLRSAVPQTGSDFVVSKSIWWGKAWRDVHSGIFPGVLEESNQNSCQEANVLWNCLKEERRWLGVRNRNLGAVVCVLRYSPPREVLQATHWAFFFFNLSYGHGGTCLTRRPEQYDSGVL